MAIERQNHLFFINLFVLKEQTLLYLELERKTTKFKVYLVYLCIELKYKCFLLYWNLHLFPLLPSTFL